MENGSVETEKEFLGRLDRVFEMSLQERDAFVKSISNNPRLCFLVLSSLPSGLFSKEQKETLFERATSDVCQAAFLTIFYNFTDEELSKIVNRILESGHPHLLDLIYVLGKLSMAQKELLRRLIITYRERR